ncbi:sensor histidine kinase [Actinophytocola oryzae]|uniref:sensor histidine kinase n=1 Tax=Actinophytocola oryzae TaxID=502181 RepID=UPI001414F882|nr:histidine kinase [Actinophytocola oryzae]
MSLAVLAFLSGLGVICLIALSRQEAGAEAAMSAVLAVTVGWAYVGSGLLTWRHGRRRIGSILVFIGLAWFATYLAYSNDSFWFTLGTALEDVYLVGVMYLVLVFPHGRLSGRVDRALMAVGVVLGTVVELAWLVLADSGVVCADCPDNAVRIVSDHAWANGILQAQRGAALVVSVVAVVLFVRRIRLASTPVRRSLAPVLWTGGAFCVAMVVTIVNDVAGEPMGQAPNFMCGLVFAAIPVSILASMLRQRLARGAVAQLVVQLDGGPGGVDLRDALSRALGDPDLAVGYWLASTETYVDSRGRPFDPDDPEKASTLVQRNGRPVAVLVHDKALQDDRALVDSVCAAAGMALENERLRADLEARLVELRASRERLVRAAESERRRLERDLHDGAQQRLIAVAMSIALAEANLRANPVAAGAALDEARDGLARAMDELRTLSQGIRPAVLVERGLGAALAELARRSTVSATVDLRLRAAVPADIETAAYYVASEALTNTAKHAHASGVTIAAETHDGLLRLRVTDDGVGGAEARDGSGLRGLADRVEGFGGTLNIHSPAAGGTSLSVELPCV